MYNILVCDDEKDIVNALDIYLKSEGYNTILAYNGNEAIEKVKTEDIHLALLDIMMPVLDGITAMVKIREISNIPVILLTAKSEDTDKILGLNVGADDYITKPFNPVEVMARVKSQLRRYMMLGGGKTNEQSIVIGTLELDDTAKKVTVDGEKVSLTPKEYEILHFLMQKGIFHRLLLFFFVYGRRGFFSGAASLWINDVQTAFCRCFPEYRKNRWDVIQLLFQPEAEKPDHNPV